MAEESNYWEYQELASPPLLNRTDPIVRHDPTIKPSTVIKWNFSDKANSINGVNTNDIDSKKVEGVAIPVIRIGNLSIDFRRIKYMYIDYDSFVPSIVVKLSQFNNKGMTSDIPGMNCDMTVVIVSQVDGAYKPVSIDFYVRNVEYDSYSVTYYGTYKLLKLDFPQCKQIYFNPGTGCSTEQCQLPENPHPTTYEFLHYAAITDLGLGLAATKQVKEIKDDRFRMLHDESYYDAIPKHVKYGGTDENSIFDCWIDLYRYLVVVNVPWVMKEDVKANELGFIATLGIDPTNSSVGKDVESKMVSRTLTNFKHVPALSNITFNNYKFEVDNSKIQDKGAIVSPIITNPVGVKEGNNNGCEQLDIKIHENSVDGAARLKEYNYRKRVDVGPEFGNSEDGNTPIQYQQQIHDAYFKKLRAKRLVIELDNPNFGLQRGTLVNIAVFEYDNENKRSMVANTVNVIGYQEGTESNVHIDKEFNDKIDADGYGMMNPTVSGMYYIDGMSFEYSDRYQKVIQRLYLIRKGFINNPTNITSEPKIAK